MRFSTDDRAVRPSANARFPDRMWRSAASFAPMSSQVGGFRPNFLSLICALDFSTDCAEDGQTMNLRMLRHYVRWTSRNRYGILGPRGGWMLMMLKWYLDCDVDHFLITFMFSESKVGIFEHLGTFFVQFCEFNMRGIEIELERALEWSVAGFPIRFPISCWYGIQCVWLNQSIFHSENELLKVGRERVYLRSPKNEPI